MISGYATPAGTQQIADQFSGLVFTPFGSTGLLVSGAGFGCYRVNVGVTAHANALKKALTSGVNLIDTSANYADGGSEQLVGEVIAALIESGRMNREQVVVVSKGGYLQGNNYALSQQRKADGNPFKEVVEYADGLEHCIHPEFLDDQIERSLKRLGLDKLKTIRKVEKKIKRSSSKKLNEILDMLDANPNMRAEDLIHVLPKKVFSRLMLYVKYAGNNQDSIRTFFDNMEK